MNIEDFWENQGFSWISSRVNLPWWFMDFITRIFMDVDVILAVLSKPTLITVYVCERSTEQWVWKLRSLMERSVGLVWHHAWKPSDGVWSLKRRSQYIVRELFSTNAFYRLFSVGSKRSVKWDHCGGTVRSLMAGRCFCWLLYYGSRF